MTAFFFSIPYLRRLFLVTAVASVFLPLLVIFYFSPEFSHLLLEMTEHRADQFARHLVSAMNIRELDLDQAVFSAAMERQVTQTRHDLGVEKVRVFKSAGRSSYPPIAPKPEPSTARLIFTRSRLAWLRTCWASTGRRFI